MLHYTNILTATGLKSNSVLGGCVCGVAGGQGQPESDPRTIRMR